jgi:GTPase
MFKVGEVKHYYNKIGVAVVELDGTLSIGDSIKFVHDGENLFEEKVESIQIEHEKKDSAGKGSVIGLSTNGAVKEGTEVFKI